MRARATARAGSFTAPRAPRFLAAILAAADKNKDGVIRPDELSALNYNNQYSGDFLKGDAGNDVIANSNGLDILMGGTGNDVVFGDSDRGSGFGSAGSRSLFTAAGTSRLPSAAAARGVRAGKQQRRPSRSGEEGSKCWA